MTTIKRGNVTIKNFGSNRWAALSYYNNIRKKDYVSSCGMGYDCQENGYCVDIIYKKK